jgi:gamma-D-glutamyl-L-lysine dipeptidyl-peptidase
MRRIVVALVFASCIAAAVPVVNVPVANMYSRPSANADVVSQARFGQTVSVREASGEWLRIATPDAYEGWVLGTAVIELERPYTGEAVVTALFAHLYRSRSVVRHAPLLTVPFETRLAVADASHEGWLEVALPDGRLAWVQRGDVAVATKPLDSAAMLELSRRFIGLPYTWGGTTSFGYDCSGFTQMLYRQRGIELPRDAHQQAAWEMLKPVEKSDLEPGDLLYFGPSREKITHTGLYLGSGEFIHATAHLKPAVQISRLDEPRWTELYLCARRAK